MNDNSVFVIFIAFGCIWLLMGVGGVIASLENGWSGDKV